jgi:hypothetical protein
MATDGNRSGAGGGLSGLIGAVDVSDSIDINGKTGLNHPVYEVLPRTPVGLGSGEDSSSLSLVRCHHAKLGVLLNISSEPFAVDAEARVHLCCRAVFGLGGISLTTRVSRCIVRVIL